MLQLTGEGVPFGDEAPQLTERREPVIELGHTGHGCDILLGRWSGPQLVSSPRDHAARRVAIGCRLGNDGGALLELLAKRHKVDRRVAGDVDRPGPELLDPLVDRLSQTCAATLGLVELIESLDMP